MLYKTKTKISTARFIGKSIAFFPGITCLLVLSGCASLKVRLGMRVYLARTPVTSIEAKLVNGPGIAPGQKLSLIVTVTEPDGKVLFTEGKGRGTVMWQDLQVTPTIVKVNNKGVVSLRHDPRISEGKVGHVTITVPSHPGISTELDIPFRYDVAFVSDFSGRQGSDGLNGLDGASGIDGSPGSLDPNNPSPGGDGTNGSDGANGQDGDPGGNAPAVQVRVTLKTESHPLLQVSVSASGHQRLYLVDPIGGSLTVKADGGLGGSGGRGGRGGRGGAGGIGTPNGRSGSDGSDGRNGSDGTSGKGGSITVTYDPQAKSFLSAIHLSSRNGPSPIFREESVAPLW